MILILILNKLFDSQSLCFNIHYIILFNDFKQVISLIYLPKSFYFYSYAMDFNRLSELKGVRDGIKSFLMENLIKNFLKKFLIKNLKNLIKNLKNDALSRNLIKGIKKYFIENLIKNLKNGALSSL